MQPFLVFVLQYVLWPVNRIAIHKMLRRPAKSPLVTITNDVSDVGDNFSIDHEQQLY